MSGITRIAILPFKTSDSSSLQRQTTLEMMSFFSQQISSTEKFELVSSEGIERLQDHTSVADAVISGQIIVLSVNNSRTEEKRRTKDADGNVVEKMVPIYLRDLKLEFTYSIMRTRDNSYIVQSEKKSTTASDQSEIQSSLADPFDLAKEAISRALGKVASDVAPSTRIEKRTLATLTKEEAKDKELKGQMKEAAKLARRDAVAAAAMYDSIYAGRNTFAAGYNQALLTEANEGVEAAIELMADLVQKTNNPTAASMLATMQRASASKQTAEAQSAAQSQSLAEKAIEQASKELLAKLPKGSRISLIDNSRVKVSLLDSVIGEIFDNLVGNGITVVDRQNQSVIDLEKQYQLSGEVSDETAVSIGKTLGLTSLVFCSIDGEGARRQLRVRAVDLQTSAVIYTLSIEI
jgi:hypothetical protein